MDTQHILSSVSQGLRPRCMRPFVEIVCASYVEVLLFVFVFCVTEANLVFDRCAGAPLAQV